MVFLLLRKPISLNCWCDQTERQAASGWCIFTKSGRRGLNHATQTIEVEIEAQGQVHPVGLNMPLPAGGISRARPVNDDALLSEAALPEDWSNSGVGKRGYGCCGLGPGWRESL